MNLLDSFQADACVRVIHKLCIQTVIGIGLKGWTGWRFTISTQWVNQDVSPTQTEHFFPRKTHYQISSWSEIIAFVGLSCEKNNQESPENRALLLTLLMSHSVTRGELLTTSLPATPYIKWRKIKENQCPSPPFAFAKCLKMFRWTVVCKWKPSCIGKYFHCCWFTASCERKATIWHHHFEERERSNAAWTKRGFVLFC